MCLLLSNCQNGDATKQRKCKCKGKLVSDITCTVGSNTHTQCNILVITGEVYAAGIAFLFKSWKHLKVYFMFIIIQCWKPDTQFEQLFFH